MLFPQDYEDALQDAPSWVLDAWDAYLSRLSSEEQMARPFLYFVLDDGTPPFKASKDNALYFHESPVEGAQCSSCPFAYEKVIKPGRFICSQIRGTIHPHAWCVIPHLRGVWKDLEPAFIRELVERVVARRSE